MPHRFDSGHQAIQNAGAYEYNQAPPLLSLSTTNDLTNLFAVNIQAMRDEQPVTVSEMGEGFDCARGHAL
jgi:hypothetical protein